MTSTSNNNRDVLIYISLLIRSDKVPPVEVKDSHNIYHNVFSFTNRLHVKAASMDPAILQQDIESCLLGVADDWYTNQLSHVFRVGLRSDTNGVKEWCDALEVRFRHGCYLALRCKHSWSLQGIHITKQQATHVCSLPCSACGL